jgi:hypothetical protein
VRTSGAFSFGGTARAGQAPRGHDEISQKVSKAILRLLASLAEFSRCFAEVSVGVCSIGRGRDVVTSEVEDAIEWAVGI